MNLSVGIVGLPNVGKSTLFNALLKKQQALAANYPFATIEPNVGVVPVPDVRLAELAEITKEEEKMASLPPVKSATIEFVDIAGLVKGASEGAGLGNKFLSHIREVEVVAHVVRAFVDPSASSGQVPIIREGSVDPKTDYETIQTELMLSDLQSCEKQLENRKLAPAEKVLLTKVKESLNTGIPVRDMKFSDEEKDLVKYLFLLSAKPEIIVLNISEDEYSVVNNQVVLEKYASLLQLPKDRFVVICAKIESELATLSDEEQREYLQELGLDASGLERLIQKAHGTLGLISFLTCGEKEVKAWTIQKGTTSQNAAGTIHNDFVKHFIKAEVVDFSDFTSLGGWKKARENGKARFEGKEYLMQDGDVVEFKIGQ